MNAMEAIKVLRTETLAPISICRQAWIESNQNIEQALSALQEQAARSAAKKADRPASQGRVEMYSHANGRIGVMVEINTETDFAARSEPFIWFCHEIALQIAAMNPEYVLEKDIPDTVRAEIQMEAETYARREGKSEAVAQKISAGMMEKYISEKVLLRQEYIRDEKVTVQDLLNSTIAKVGENIVIQRFLRWEIVHDEE